MSLYSDFKKFAFKGNVLDLAIGVVIGGAFSKIVSALVADFIMPFVALMTPSGDWRAAGLTLRHAAEPKDNVVLKYGDFLGSVVDFLIVAFTLFVVMSKLIKVLESKIDAPATATTKECPFCLEKIPVKATKCKACASTLPDEHAPVTT